eukprot:229098_1
MDPLTICLLLKLIFSIVVFIGDIAGVGIPSFSVGEVNLFRKEVPVSAGDTQRVLAELMRGNNQAFLNLAERALTTQWKNFDQSAILHSAMDQIGNHDQRFVAQFVINSAGSRHKISQFIKSVDGGQQFAQAFHQGFKARHVSNIRSSLSRNEARQFDQAMNDWEQELGGHVGGAREGYGGGGYGGQQFAQAFHDGFEDGSRQFYRAMNDVGGEGYGGNKDSKIRIICGVIIMLAVLIMIGFCVKSKSQNGEQGEGSPQHTTA